ncbi:hypothetical protein ACJMK2_018446 [Sinanodonta woodiana]|uniref:Homeobox domain-containing protein n=1 Tax=Sinanodonta woodiana TaxID=1069815 RepID=A0ABD3UF46_SINWO
MENMSTDANKTVHSVQSASKKHRHIFTDEQLHVLELEWTAGLTSVKDGGRIENLANTLNITVQQIRDWIGNKRQRQKHSIQQPSVSSSASKTVPMQLKGPSGYNMFCKGKSLVCNFKMSERLEFNFLDSQTNSSPAVDEVKKKYVSQVRQIFNDCWAKATGTSKVPYKIIKDNMYSVEIRNMPNGVKFSSMRLSTLKEIISVRDSLEFSVTRTNQVATRTSLDEPCQMNQDHDEVQNIMQESLEDDGKQKTFVPNPVEAELLMDITDSEDTNSK